MDCCLSSQGAIPWRSRAEQRLVVIINIIVSSDIIIASSLHHASSTNAATTRSHAIWNLIQPLLGIEA